MPKTSPAMVILFTRLPEAGRSKTRLIPVLGAERAAELQREMAQWAVGRAREFASRRKVQLEVRFAGGPFDVAQGRREHCRTGGSAERMQDWLGPGIEYLPQCEGDLGARMAGAFADAFTRGSQRVVLIGTDCPGITAGLLAEAFDALRRCDVALGPAADGGYYLIGLRRRRAASRSASWGTPELFEGILWGAADVLERTLSHARALRLSVHTLQTLQDVDRPEDLAVWEQVIAKSKLSS